VHEFEPKLIINNTVGEADVAQAEHIRTL